MSDWHYLFLPRPASMKTIRHCLAGSHELNRDLDLGELEELNVRENSGQLVCVIERESAPISEVVEEAVLGRISNPDALQGFQLRYCKWPGMNHLLARLADRSDAWIYLDGAEGALISGAAYALQVRINPAWSPFVSPPGPFRDDGKLYGGAA
jgi:hypothetical protein